jgi:hypothetical protein
VASHSYSAPDSEEPVEESELTERRAWLRLPSRLYTVCYPAKGPTTEPVPCRVLNVSAAGVSLAIKRPLEAGIPLTVQLPGLVEGFEASVLTHVSHVRLMTNGEWSIGCTLALELDDDTLLEFGIKKLDPLPIDQRGWRRFTVTVPVRYSTLTDDAVHGHANLTDLSPVGVGLQLDLPLRVGTSLNLHIGDGEMFLNILACVVRVTSHYSKNWRAGATFIRELSEKELLRIV